MSNNYPTTTFFKTSRKYKKEQQERKVGQLFGEEYERVTGEKLVMLRRTEDPPDLKYKASHRMYGVELTELAYFNSGRAMAERIINAMYRELEDRNVGDRYLGLGIDFLGLLMLNTVEHIKIEWKQHGINKAFESCCAREFADLLMDLVASTTDVSNTSSRMKIVTVDPVKYPALALLSDKIAMVPTATHTELRSDKRSAPLIKLWHNYLLYPEQIKDIVVDKIKEKINKKINEPAKWRMFDTAILVLHDFPREQFYEVFWLPLDNDVKEEIRSTLSVLNVFDEVWTICAVQRGGENRGQCIYKTYM